MAIKKMSELDRGRVIRISISSLIATLSSSFVVMTGTWVVIKPLLIDSVSAAMADETADIVNDQIRPINVALRVIIQNNIDTLERQIAAMEYQRDFPPDGDWTAADAAILTQVEIDLGSARDALKALKGDNSN